MRADSAIIAGFATIAKIVKTAKVAEVATIAKIYQKIKPIKKTIKMRNAKEELLQLLKGKAKVKCATITNGKDILLKVGYSENEWTEFLKSLNFSYDSGYGSQNLFGTVWLEDGTWCTRGEYDGSEWWEHNQLPEIPSFLR